MANGAVEDGTPRDPQLISGPFNVCVCVFFFSLGGGGGDLLLF